VRTPEYVHLLIYPHHPKLEMGKVGGRIQEAATRRAIACLGARAPHWAPRITVREGSRLRRRF